MVISREFIPFIILKQIGDPAYQIFRGAYVSEMGDAEADDLMQSFLERNEALCNREMGWCIPDLGNVLRKFHELDYDKPLNSDTLPAFQLPEQVTELTFKEEKDLVFFFHENEKYGCFSQWYKSPFTIEGTQFVTAEQYMMSRKALLFRDYEIYDQILKENDPQKCKKLGKKVNNFKGYQWDKCKEDIVYRANLAKFSQNVIIQQILLETGTSILAEASPYDRIWGIGRSADDPKANYPELWKGENLLGNALMRVRWELSLMNQIMNVENSGVHAAFDNNPDCYYVSPDQKKEMDKLLKMITGATKWEEGDILTYTSLDD